MDKSNAVTLAEYKLRVTRDTFLKAWEEWLPHAGAMQAALEVAMLEKALRSYVDQRHEHPQS